MLKSSDNSSFTIYIYHNKRKDTVIRRYYRTILLMRYSEGVILFPELILDRLWESVFLLSTP